MEEFRLEKLAFYTMDDSYVFINNDLEKTGLKVCFAGDFILSLANFDIRFFKFILSCTSIAFANNELSVIKNSSDSESIGNYFLSKSTEILNLSERTKGLKESKDIELLESILKHYMFRTFDISDIIQFIYKDFFEIYSRWELPVTARILLWECINALLEFKQETPQIGIVELTDLCQAQIEKYISLAQSIIENDYTIVDNLKQDISIRVTYYPHLQKALSIYYLTDLESMFAFDAVFLQENSVTIKKCANCGKYFIPVNRSDEIYCNEVYENGKTCKQVGYENKLKADGFKTAYRRAYKTQRARIAYNRHITDYEEKHFKPWEKAAKQALLDYTTKNDIEGFNQWLKDNKDSF